MAGQREDYEAEEARAPGFQSEDLWEPDHLFSLRIQWRLELVAGCFASDFSELTPITDSGFLLFLLLRPIRIDTTSPLVVVLKCGLLFCNNQQLK